MNILPSAPGRNSRCHLLPLRVPKKAPCLWGELSGRICGAIGDRSASHLEIASTQLQTWVQTSLGACHGKFRVSLVMKAGNDDGVIRLYSIPQAVRESFNIASAHVFNDFAM